MATHGTTFPPTASNSTPTPTLQHHASATATAAFHPPDSASSVSSINPLIMTFTHVNLMKSLLTIEARFWSKVAKKADGCWLWTAGRDKDGYGVFQTSGKQVRSHRFAWQFANGSIPQGLLVCHTCETPACCNPAHLFVGTHDVNVADKVAKDRQARGDKCGSRLYPERRPHGEQHSSSKLSAAQVSAIRRRYIPGLVSMHSLALEFAVSPQGISKIIRRVTWRHLS